MFEIEQEAQFAHQRRHDENLNPNLYFGFCSLSSSISLAYDWHGWGGCKETLLRTGLVWDPASKDPLQWFKPPLFTESASVQVFQLLKSSIADVSTQTASSEELRFRTEDRLTDGWKRKRSTSALRNIKTSHCHARDTSCAFKCHSVRMVWLIWEAQLKSHIQPFRLSSCVIPFNDR